MRIEQKILFLGIAIILLGCGGNKDKRTQQPIIQKTKEALGDNGKELGCNGNTTKDGEECREDSSSNFILNTLEEESNDSKEKDDSLRNQLDTLLEDMQEEDAKNSNKDDLESLVNQVGELLEKDSNKVANGLESLVNTYDKENNAKSIKNELESLVEGVEKSKLKREEVESKLLSLVNEVEDKQTKKEEVKEKLLALVGDASKEKRQTKLSLESLVNSAEKKGTKEAKRLASSIIKDVSQKKIKILRTEDTYVVIRVQTGDNLSALAAKYYGDAAKYKIIYEANKEKIGNRHTIYPGTTLVIPKLENIN